LFWEAFYWWLFQAGKANQMPGGVIFKVCCGWSIGFFPIERTEMCPSGAIFFENQDFLAVKKLKFSSR